MDQEQIQEQNQEQNQVHETKVIEQSDMKKSKSLVIKMPRRPQVKRQQIKKPVVEYEEYDHTTIDFISLETKLIEYENKLIDEDLSTEDRHNYESKVIMEDIVVDKMDINKINRFISMLKDQITTLDNEILNLDYEDQLKEHLLERLKNRIEKYKLVEAEKRMESINNFMKKAQKRRTNNNKESKIIFDKARKDAEDRVFSVLAMDKGDIADCFSTPDLYIDPTRGSVRPRKFIYSWFQDLRKRENNVIPLSPGIEVPKKIDKEKGIIKNIDFQISFFLQNEQFIERCKKYYRCFGLEFIVQKDNKIRNKWWIKLRVDNPEKKIFFLSEEDNPKIEVTNKVTSNNFVGEIVYENTWEKMSENSD